LIAFGELGLLPHQFWELTYGELMLMIKARREQDKEQLRVMMYQAWLTAYFSRVEKLPDFKTFLRQTVDKPTPEELAKAREEWLKIKEMAEG
jgi:hypothetical protein